MALHDVEHLGITQLDLVLLCLSPHKLELFVRFVVVSRVVVLLFLLKSCILVQEGIITGLELLDTSHAVTLDHGHVDLATAAYFNFLFFLLHNSRGR